jgi:hypothetical protein
LVIKSVGGKVKVSWFIIFATATAGKILGLEVSVESYSFSLFLRTLGAKAIEEQ